MVLGAVLQLIFRAYSWACAGKTLAIIIKTSKLRVLKPENFFLKTGVTDSIIIFGHFLRVRNKTQPFLFYFLNNAFFEKQV
jgi:hypothetical protein